MYNINELYMWPIHCIFRPAQSSSEPRVPDAKSQASGRWVWFFRSGSWHVARTVRCVGVPVIL